MRGPTYKDNMKMGLRLWMPSWRDTSRWRPQQSWKRLSPRVLEKTAQNTPGLGKDHGSCQGLGKAHVVLEKTIDHGTCPWLGKAYVVLKETCTKCTV